MGGSNPHIPHSGGRILGTVTNGGSLSGISASPFGPRFGESGVVFVFPPDRSRLDSSRAFRNQVMGYFGYQGSIDLPAAARSVRTPGPARRSGSPGPHVRS